LTYSALTRKDKILWYWRPLSFGFALGFFWSLLPAFVIAGDWSYWFQELHHSVNADVLTQVEHLRGQALNLVIADYLVNQGFDTACRTSIITAFIAFALNQTKGTWADNVDTALTLIFGKTHYSILGFLTADLAKVLWIVVLGLFALIVVLGFIVQRNGIEF
jgi:hypothetical protein